MVYFLDCSFFFLHIIADICIVCIRKLYLFIIFVLLKHNFKLF